VKFRDGVLALSGLVVYMVTGSMGLIPFKFSTPVILIIGFVAVLFWRDPNFLGFLDKDYSFGGKNSELAVDPNDALRWLQEDYIPNQPGKRPLNLDSTSVENKKHFTKIQKVNENGEKKVKFGVIGRPREMKDREMIAYVVHCDEGWAEYSGELHDSEERLDPFNGRHQWISNAGYKAKVDDGSRGSRKGSVNIYQGGPDGVKNSEGGGDQ